MIHSTKGGPDSKHEDGASREGRGPSPQRNTVVVAATAASRVASNARIIQMIMQRLFRRVLALERRLTGQLRLDWHVYAQASLHMN